MDSFSIEVLSNDLPSHVTYDADNFKLTTNPTESSQMGTFNITFLAINNYGMSVQLTYSISIVEKT